MTLTIQRVRLANQLSCSLSGIVYILDEPCKGLHYRDIDSIIKVTKSLIKKGNTVIAIEHNKQYITEADKIIELGPVGGGQKEVILLKIQQQKKIMYTILLLKRVRMQKNQFVSME